MMRMLLIAAAVAAISTGTAYAEGGEGNGPEGIVQNASSLPVAFSSGTLAFTQSESVEHYLQVQAERQAAHDTRVQHSG